jgi:choline monooxygenase
MTLENQKQSGSISVKQSVNDYTREDTHRATRVSVDRAMTLIPEAYWCDVFRSIESERVWSKSWVCIGYTAQLREPGDCVVATVADQSIFVTRADSGNLRAYYNVCRHRGSTLLDESGRQNVISCPYHGWGYSRDGELLRCPYFEGTDVSAEDEDAFDMSKVKDFRKKDYGLLSVHVDNWGCFVFVNLDQAPVPLSDFLGDLP